MSLAEPKNRDPFLTVAMFCTLRRKFELSDERIAEHLQFNSVEEMRDQLKDWDLPDWLVGVETNSDKKKGRGKRTPSRLRNVGPRKDLPPARNAAELYKERLEALLKNVELLQHVDESLYGEYFGRTNVEMAHVFHSFDPDEEGVWDVVSLPGTVARSPSEIEVTLIGVFALAGGRMDSLLDALHPDSPSVGSDTWEEIRQCIEGSRPHDKKDGLKVLARQVATWVRGGEVGTGRPPELPAMDHAVASITTKYRKDGLTDEEIARKLAHLKKEDGTSYSTKDVTKLGDLDISWSQSRRTRTK